MPAQQITRSAAVSRAVYRISHVLQKQPAGFDLQITRFHDSRQISFSLRVPLYIVRSSGTRCKKSCYTSNPNSSTPTLIILHRINTNMSTRTCLYIHQETLLIETVTIFDLVISCRHGAPPAGNRPQASHLRNLTPMYCSTLLRHSLI